MMPRLPAILAVIRRDLLVLWPLVLLGVGLFSIETMLSNIEITISNPLLQSLIIALPQLNVLLMGIIAIALVQLDPARSVTHDWLARPLSPLDLFLAKLLFLLLTTALPIFLSRFLFDLVSGYSLPAALAEASIPRNWFALMAVMFLAGLAMLSRSVLQTLILFVAVILLFSFAGMAMDSFPRNMDAFDDDATTEALIWIMVVPLRVLFILTFLVLFWMLYFRRDWMRAQLVFACSLLVSIAALLGVFVLPMWQPVFDLLPVVIADEDSTESQQIELDSLYGCFPASVLPANDTANASGQRLIGREFWEEEDLLAAGAGSLSFVTSYTARAIPSDWRVNVLRARARYAADGKPDLVRLRPARRRLETDDAAAGTVLSQYWLLPNADRQRLAQASDIHLTLDFSLALLRPNSQRLMMDGETRHLPGIGYCSASRNQFENLVEIECIVSGTQPSLLSASLVGVRSSEVDALSPRYWPSWGQLSSGARYAWELKSPSLVNSDEINVTAYEAVDFVSRRQTTAGLLGPGGRQCSLPESSALPNGQRQSWTDRSPHDVSYVTVDNGVNLEVLDWGGSGQALVLLHGLGATAHTYDEIAPQLTQNHRVIGITRRGIGNSGRPQFGYSIPELSRDVIRVLDAMGIDQAVLVGHSLGGDELSYIGKESPERAAGLVYLDAAYDRTLDNFEERRLNRFLPPIPRASYEDLLDPDSFSAYLTRLGGNPIPPGEVIVSLNFNTGERTFDPRIMDAIVAQVYKPDYPNILVPVLGIYAVLDSPQRLMNSWYDLSDSGLVEIVQRKFEVMRQYQQQQISWFTEGIPDVKTVLVDGASHSIHYSHPQLVIDELNRFSASLPK